MGTKKAMQLLVFLVIWVGLTGIKFDATHLFFTIMAPISAVYLASKLSLIPKSVRFDFFKFIRYAIWLMVEVIKSSISVSKIAWSQNIAIHPSVQPIISLQETELGVVVYANSITLTPGTVTLSTDDNRLLVHALDIRFMEDLQEGVMDRKVKEIMCIK